MRSGPVDEELVAHVASVLRIDRGDVAACSHRCGGGCARARAPTPI
jgi:hypothetical protein